MAVEDLESANATTTIKIEDYYDFSKQIENFDDKSLNPIKSYSDLLSTLKIRGLSSTSPINGLKAATLFPEKEKSSHIFDGAVYITPWRLIANISAKLISFDKASVLLECLIDKEDRLYEEREFNASLFEGYDLQVGFLFKICLYQRNNQEMIEIKNDQRLVSKEDFPKIDFFEEFKDLNLNTTLG